LRAETISAVSETGGHLGADLGVVELTVALHAVFDTPRDRLIWDVGHQSYPHKILTVRREKIRSLHQKDGLSGFTKRSESPQRRLGFCSGAGSGWSKRDRSRRCNCGDWRWRYKRWHGL